MTNGYPEYNYRLEMPNQYEIYYPALDEVFRIPYDLPWATEGERIARRIEFFNKMNNSPTPAIVKKFQRWATLTDDIQDFLVTADVSMRIGLRVLRRWAPRFAEKIAGKLVPGLGYILMAGDILNILTALLSLPSGPWAIKQVVEAAVQGLPRRSKATRRAIEKLARLSIKWTEWLQVAQFSEDATGLGLRLGPIQGFLTDSFYGMTKDCKVIYPWQRPGTIERKAFKALQAVGEGCEFWQFGGEAYTTRAFLAAEEAMFRLGSQAQINDWPEQALANSDLPIPTHNWMPDSWFNEGHAPGEAVGQALQVYDSASIIALQDFIADPEADVGQINYEFGQHPTVQDILNEEPGRTGITIADSFALWSEYWYANPGLQSVNFNEDALDTIFAHNPLYTFADYIYHWQSMVRPTYYNLYPPADTSVESMAACYLEHKTFFEQYGRAPTFNESCVICKKHWGKVSRTAPTQYTWELP